MSITRFTTVMYFISKNNSKEGPYTLEEVLAMRLTDDILVWKDGMIAWSKISELPEFKNVVIKTPPSLPDEKENEKKGNYNKAKKKAAVNIIVYSLLIGLGVATIVAFYFNEMSYTNEWPDKYHIFHSSEEKNNHFLTYLPFLVLHLLVFEIIALIIAGVKIAKMSQHNLRDSGEVSSNSLLFYVGRFIGTILGIFGLLFGKNKH